MTQRVRYVLLPVIFLTLFTCSHAQKTAKLRIGLLDFSTTGGLSRLETVTLTNRLRSMLVKTNAFVVLERGKMEEILDEQGFQQTGCTTTECAVEVGKLLNVQKMVSGAIGKIGRTYTIDLTLIDVKTAQIEKSFFQDFQGEIDGLLSIMEDIAVNIASIAGQKEILTPPQVEEKKIFQLSIKSDPSGATIFINDQRAGETPFNSRVREGLSLEIKLQKKNYTEWARKFTVRGDVDINEKLEFSDSYKRELARRVQDEKKTTTTTTPSGGTSAWWYIGGGAVLAGTAAVLLMSGGGGNGTDGDGDVDQGFPLPPGRPGN